MAKDQLGWEQILKSEPAARDSANELEQALAAKPVAPKLGSAKKKTVRKRKSAVSESDKPMSSQSATSQPAAPVAYAKKDWSSLEIKPAVKAVDAAVEKLVEKSTDFPEQKTKTPPKSSRNYSQISSQNSTASLPVAATVEDVEPQIISVSDLNRHIREILEGTFPLLWLKGEISNFKAHTSGHFYFSLKDAKAQISAVMFRGFNSQLRFAPEDGMEVLVRGKVTVYEPRGNYQIFCETMEPVGAGALQKAFEQLKEKLRKEGLFDEARKRPLPPLPKHIAIVTSPTGAAIRDMLNILARRYKGANITVIPCKVQGDQAPSEIVAAIALAQKMPDIDVMIVGRGGGSIEDLWAFNDERVARAIAGVRVPVISAVGHEIDFTIADFVADLRAPTPSAAAELVVKNASDLSERVNTLARSLRISVLTMLNGAKQIVTSSARRLVDPQRRISEASQRCDELMQRFEMAVLRGFFDRRNQVEMFEKRMGTPLARIGTEVEVLAGLKSRLNSGARNSVLRKREALEKNMAVLDSLSPLRVLDRGFSMVVVGEKIVTDSAELKTGQVITVRMRKGAIEAEVRKIKEIKQ
jgi:exodeoxyribonuclease VII large subunit